ncbi:VOC family protein [Kiloniella sp.]|uniref:VOC family protein n=1 Tax=Kiloniella sp. TaxID=1938587 RepID=UPI003B015D0A
MISHVYIGVSDFKKAFEFYDDILSELGLVLKFSEPEKPWAGWMMPGQARPLFLIGTPENGEDCSAGNGQMMALLAPSREAVGRAYIKALDRGAQCAGKPGLRPQYHPDYYGAYFHDLDGNKICLVCHEPQ